MGRERPQERMYREEEVSEILQRASGLEKKKQLERPALSLAEIEAIGGLHRKVEALVDRLEADVRAQVRPAPGAAGQSPEASAAPGPGASGR